MWKTDTMILLHVGGCLFATCKELTYTIVSDNKPMGEEVKLSVLIFHSKVRPPYMLYT